MLCIQRYFSAYRACNKLLFESLWHSSQLNKAVWPISYDIKMAFLPRKLCAWNSMLDFFFKPSNINADTMSGESFFFFFFSPHKHEPHSVQWVFIFKNYVWRNIPIKATLTFLTVFCFAAQNVTVEEILSSYKQACQKLNCKPIPKVLKQIQVRLNIIQTHSWHTTDRLSQWCCQPTSDKVFFLFVCLF